MYNFFIVIEQPANVVSNDSKNQRRRRHTQTQYDNQRKKNTGRIPRQEGTNFLKPHPVAFIFYMYKYLNCFFTKI